MGPGLLLCGGRLGRGEPVVLVIQGPVGDRGDRGEPGDPGYPVSTRVLRAGKTVRPPPQDTGPSLRWQCPARSETPFKRPGLVTVGEGPWPLLRAREVEVGGDRLGLCPRRGVLSGPFPRGPLSPACGWEQLPTRLSGPVPLLREWRALSRPLCRRGGGSGRDSDAWLGRPRACGVLPWLPAPPRQVPSLSLLGFQGQEGVQGLRGKPGQQGQPVSGACCPSPPALGVGSGH